MTFFCPEKKITFVPIEKDNTHHHCHAVRHPGVTRRNVGCPTSPSLSCGGWTPAVPQLSLGSQNWKTCFSPSGRWGKSKNQRKQKTCKPLFVTKCAMKTHYNQHLLLDGKLKKEEKACQNVPVLSKLQFTWAIRCKCGGISMGTCTIRRTSVVVSS